MLLPSRKRRIQRIFSMYPNLPLPDGLFFGGGIPALNQLGIEAYGIIVRETGN